VAGKTPYSGTFLGRDGVVHFFQALAGAVDVLHFAPERFIDAGDTVVVVGGEQLRAKATGRAYENRWVQIWTLHAGRVVAFEEHFDTAAAEAAFAGK
jgi:ketosteroid isomerase-like protein